METDDITSPPELRVVEDEDDDEEDIQEVNVPMMDSSLMDLSRRDRRAPGGLMDIPNMLDTFDAMPSAVKSYVMYQLLRRCPKNTLQTVANVVNPALMCDFLTLLPPLLHRR